MKRSSADVEFMVWGGYDILAQITAMNLAMSHLTEDTLVLGGKFVTFDALGIRKGEFNLAGFFDDGATALQAAFNGIADERLAALFNLGTNTLGAVCIGMEANTLGSHNITTGKEEFVKATAQAMSTGQFDFPMKCIYPQQAVTGNFTATALNESATWASPTARGGVLHYTVTELDLDGGTKLNLSAESGDGAVYGAITGSSKDFTANGSYRLPVTGTIGTRVRLLGTWTGGGAGKTAMVVAAWKRKPPLPA